MLISVARLLNVTLKPNLRRRTAKRLSDNNSSGRANSNLSRDVGDGSGMQQWETSVYTYVLPFVNI